LVPSAKLIPGPRATATLLIDDLDFPTAPSRGVAGVVEAIANSPDGGVYLAGDFTGVHGVPRNRLARLLANGEVDLGFNSRLGPDGNVTALAVQPDGKLLIAGDFAFVSGVPRTRVARLNPDGTLDATFDPGAGPSSTNGIPFIRSLVLKSDGRVLVGGAFSHFEGQPRGLLAQLNSDGALDTQFVSPFWGPTSINVPRTDAPAIQALAVTGGTNVLAAGSMYFNPSPSYASVVRLTGGGQIDSRFRITPDNVGQVAWSMAVQSDGKLLVGGAAGFYSGVFRPPTFETNWVAIRRYHTNGILDSTFHQQNTPQIKFSSSEVRQLVLQPDGRVLFVAAIHQPGSRLSELVLDRAIIGRVLADGSWDSSFAMITCALPLIKGSGPFWFDFPTARLFDRGEMPVPTAFAARQPDGVVVLAGAFDSVNGEPRRRLARLEPDGDLRGVLRLDIGHGVTPALTGPGEVEIPYVVESSPDLQNWTPWRTNASPWQGWREAIQIGEDHRFFRAVGP
jgi:uncharacterized delta-60 repeat protein